jgi:hypothetical protein
LGAASAGDDPVTILAPRVTILFGGPLLEGEKWQ